MTPEQIVFNDVQALARDAYWYAVGRKHAGGDVNEWTFSAHYGRIVRAMLTGETSHRPSIHDAYDAYAR